MAKATSKKEANKSKTTHLQLNVILRPSLRTDGRYSTQLVPCMPLTIAHRGFLLCFKGQ